jgi:hypothetical protein
MAIDYSAKRFRVVLMQPGKRLCRQRLCQYMCTVRQLPAPSGSEQLISALVFPDQYNLKLKPVFKAKSPAPHQLVGSCRASVELCLACTTLRAKCSRFKVKKQYRSSKKKQTRNYC